MKASCRSGLSITIMTMGLAACASLSIFTDDPPLTRHVCLDGFSENQEFRATLSAQISDRNEKYFLAIRTAKDSADIAVLAPQGIPMYSIHCSDTGVEVSSQARLAGGIQPTLMLSYLEMIFIGEADLRKLLKPQWTLDQQEDKRLLVKHSADGQAGRKIQVVYLGDTPWFREVKLEDPQRETTLTLVTLGDSFELPE